MARPSDPHAIASALKQPLTYRGRTARYRFPNQKAAIIARAIDFIDEVTLSVLSDLDLRDALMQVAGIGLKTSSFIVRNYRRSNQVAILDIHIQRAGQHIGLFSKEASVQSSYLEMERQMLLFAEAIGVDASVLDGVIWDYGRQIGDLWSGIGSNKRQIEAARATC
jgi:thermostable 8-oxoguanine DNA glycosylase